MPSLLPYLSICSHLVLLNMTGQAFAVLHYCPALPTPPLLLLLGRDGIDAKSQMAYSTTVLVLEKMHAVQAHKEEGLKAVQCSGGHTCMVLDLSVS